MVRSSLVVVLALVVVGCSSSSTGGTSGEGAGGGATTATTGAGGATATGAGGAGGAATTTTSTTGAGGATTTSSGAGGAGGAATTTTTTTTTSTTSTTTSTTGAGGAGGAGGAAPSGACTGASDLAILSSDPVALQKTVAACAAKNFGQDPATEDCIRKETGLTPGCAGCFGDAVTCTMKSCLNDCLADQQSKACVDCRVANCDPAFVACAGVSP